MKVLVTGAAGFIGYHVVNSLLARGDHVVGLDNLNSYYSVNLKRDRLKNIISKNFTFVEGDLSSYSDLKKIFLKHEFDGIIHLGAQAGVRYSIENPDVYIDSNINGFLNILELSSKSSINHLVFASSSSVYGANTNIPFSESDHINHPISLYAATKRSNELMAHAYSHLNDLPISGLRFFTVYGPWGRPDMAYYLFTEAILKQQPIKIFNNGLMKRDFTYIDDIVEGVIRVFDKPPNKNMKNIESKYDINNSVSNYQVFNIGNNEPVTLKDFIATIEEAAGKKAIKEYLPMQPGDVVETFADIEALNAAVDFKPNTELSIGIGKFVDWYKSYNNF